jgi:hypothetical protein
MFRITGCAAGPRRVPQAASRPRYPARPQPTSGGTAARARARSNLTALPGWAWCGLGLGGCGVRHCFTHSVAQGLSVKLSTKPFDEIVAVADMLPFYNHEILTGIQ